MALPSRKQQIDAVAKFLDSDRNEGRSLDEIATDIVDGYWDAVTPPPPPRPLRVGMLIKTLISGKVYRIIWTDGERLWVAPEAGQGWLGSASDRFWTYCEEYHPSAMRETNEIGSNGKPKKKRFELSDEEIDEAWTNPDWKVGDKVSQHQKEHDYTIIATSPAAVLMEHARTGVLYCDTNKNLEKYYKRELKQEEW